MTILLNTSNQTVQNSSQKLLLLQENLKHYLSFGCRIPINSNKDDNNVKVRCGAKTERNREPKLWLTREGGKSESNMNTHLREN